MDTEFAFESLDISLPKSEFESRLRQNTRQLHLKKLKTNVPVGIGLIAVAFLYGQPFTTSGMLLGVGVQTLIELIKLPRYRKETDSIYANPENKELLGPFRILFDSTGLTKKRSDGMYSYYPWNTIRSIEIHSASRVLWVGPGVRIWVPAGAFAPAAWEELYKYAKSAGKPVAMATS